MDLTVVIIAVIAIIIIIVAAYRSGRTAGSIEKGDSDDKKHNSSYLREVLYRDQQIQKLQSQIDDMNKLNGRYLAFIFSISTVVQRLNTTLKSEEILSTIIRLVSDIIPTDKVELYILDMNDNLLKKVVSHDQSPEEQVIYALGEGLVGNAAKDRMIKLKGSVDKGYPDTKDTRQTDSQIWMAVPINFKERLLGVIGIGQIKNPVGNESNLMKMLADIAGVVLINRAVLGEAKHEANTDPLTGLKNRRFFFNMAQTYVEKAIIESSPISIFLFDIDNFKHYNDTNGHDEGDRLLKELGKIVTEGTRKTSIVARYGGEEFIVMLPGILKEDAFVYAERLRKTISEYPFPHREKQPLGCVSVSGGIASFPHDADSIQKVINLSDKALYQAKSEGRNRVVTHKPFHFSESDVSE